MTDWVEIARRNARSVQTTIGWIFWDPGAIERHEHLGLATNPPRACDSAIDGIYSVGAERSC